MVIISENFKLYIFKETKNGSCLIHFAKFELENNNIFCAGYLDSTQKQWVFTKGEGNHLSFSDVKTILESLNENSKNKN